MSSPFQGKAGEWLMDKVWNLNVAELALPQETVEWGSVKWITCENSVWADDIQHCQWWPTKKHKKDKQ